MSTANTNKKPSDTRKFRGVVMPTAAHKVIRRVKRAGHEPSIHGTKTLEIQLPYY